MKEILYLKLFVIVMFSVISIKAQTATPTPTPTPTPDDAPDFIVPSRPTVSNPAQFQKSGVLQLEFGYNGNFKSADYQSQQDVPLALRFAVNRRLLIELDLDNPYSQTDKTGFRQTGAGDTTLGAQVVLQYEKESRPGIAFAYFIKIPTASAEKNLGTGKVDSNFIGLVSKKIGEYTVDFNAIYLLAGRTRRRGQASSGKATLAVSRGITSTVGIAGEISGYSRNDQQTGASFGLGAVSYRVSRRVSLDTGLRFGLTSDAPRIGLVGGITVGVADLYKKRH